MSDNYNLQRFVDAQAGIYDRVVEELRAGRKRSHWMWYIFPQITGLGSRLPAQKYAIASREEALAYGSHPILGHRLTECTQCVVSVLGRTAEQIFAYPDYLKFRSSLTLFDDVTRPAPVFRAALSKYFAGQPDPSTLDILSRMAAY
jgi:uncharacterized protein (DUF1810 family)